MLKKKVMLGAACAACAASLTATFVAASPAHAIEPTVSARVESEQVVIRDMPGDFDLYLRVLPYGDTGKIKIEASYEVVPGPGCLAESVTVVVCEGIILPHDGVLVFADKGDDRIEINPLDESLTLTAIVLGGPGDDTLLGGVNYDGFWGEAGNDILDGRGGTDHLHGGGGADRLTGGPGVDWVYYDEKTSRVQVSLNGLAGDDGTSGEGDTVGADVENIIGSVHDDTLTGNDASNNIFGNDGRDKIEGLGGNDTIAPDGALDDSESPLLPDVVYGGPGSDTILYMVRVTGTAPTVIIDLDAEWGDDGAVGEGDTYLEIENIDSRNPGTLTGNAGANVIRTDPALGNTVYAGGGNDTIYGLSLIHI